MKKFFKIFADLKFAISLLFLICFIIFIGSIIEQEQTIEFYQKNYPIEKPIFGFINWKFINFFQFDHIYKTSFFIFILILLGISLITCSVIQQFPTLKFSRQCNFHKTSNIDIKIIINKIILGNLFTKMKKKGYFIFQQKANFYCTKGLIGKIAPLFVHLSLILILLGSIIDSISNFNAQELITKSEIFHVQNSLSSGFFTSFFQQPIRVNDFWINYYENIKIKQFYSNISILNSKGKEVVNKTISVNNPLIYKNITFYQTDWFLTGLRIQEEENFFQVPLIPINQSQKKFWLTWLPLNKFFKDDNFGRTIIINDYRENFLIYDLNGNLLNTIDNNEYIINKQYKIIDLISATGLQIKSNIGINYIYIGFGFLMISTIFSYISFFQIWGISSDLNKKNDLTFYAKTNKNKTYLDIEILKLTKKY